MVNNNMTSDIYVNNVQGFIYNELSWILHLIVVSKITVIFISVIISLAYIGGKSIESPFFATGQMLTFAFFALFFAFFISDKVEFNFYSKHKNSLKTIDTLMLGGFGRALANHVKSNPGAYAAAAKEGARTYHEKRDDPNPNSKPNKDKKDESTDEDKDKLTNEDKDKSTNEDKDKSTNENKDNSTNEDKNKLDNENPNDKIDQGKSSETEPGQESLENVKNSIESHNSGSSMVNNNNVFKSSNMNSEIYADNINNTTLIIQQMRFNVESMLVQFSDLISHFFHL